MNPARGDHDRRQTAWGYLVANLAVLPGSGSVMAGHRVAGLLQVALSLAGFCLSCWFAYVTLRSWWLHREVVLPEGRVLLSGVVGVGLFVIAWLWALATSLAILRASAPGGDGGRP